MPRDKTLSHEKVNRAIREEFLEKGFEAASVRSIGDRAGMTSAGLYRHYPDKAAMFDSLVEPVVTAIENWTNDHKKNAYKMVEERDPDSDLFAETFLDLIMDIILPYKVEFRLLLTSSRGTKYENFVNDFVLENQTEMMKMFGYLKSKGFPVKEISEEELHILLSAYLTACFEPVVHGFSDEQIETHLSTVREFFLPGWRNLMGMK
ncbi:MAG: TetR/AcrR family transcriptional regulator [Saccharofermentans sp.]|nr:TetR/AcrR family transcriptional regulator [Saccharofermentans sp.]